MAAISGGFTVDGNSWDYSVSNAALQFLGNGESITLSFNVKASDDSGAPNNSDTEVVTLSLTGTNDAPVLNAAATPVLQNVTEDAGGPIGAVGTLVSTLVNLNPPAGGLDNVADADNGAVTGIALTGLNAVNGTWFYSTNGGANWTAVGVVSDSSALLLAADANTRLYFQPNANFNGTVTNAITFRAWDQSSGSAGSTANTAEQRRYDRVLGGNGHRRYQRDGRQRQLGCSRRRAVRVEQHRGDAVDQRAVGERHGHRRHRAQCDCNQRRHRNVGHPGHDQPQRDVLVHDHVCRRHCRQPERRHAELHGK